MAGCLYIILMFILSLLLSPILCFLGGYISGVILNWFVGDMIVIGLNTIFNTTRFSVSQLPIVCGAIAVIGSFFKSSLTTKKD